MQWEPPVVLGTAENRGVWLWTFKVERKGIEVKALLDSGASQLFLAPCLVKGANETPREFEYIIKFRAAAGVNFEVTQAVVNLRMHMGELELTHDFLVRLVPCKVILGVDWLYQQRVLWGSTKRILYIVKEGKEHMIRCEAIKETTMEKETGREKRVLGRRKQAAEVHQEMITMCRD